MGFSIARTGIGCSPGPASAPVEDACSRRDEGEAPNGADDDDDHAATTTAAVLMSARGTVLSRPVRRAGAVTGAGGPIAAAAMGGATTNDGLLLGGGGGSGASQGTRFPSIASNAVVAVRALAPHRAPVGGAVALALVARMA